jgi:hypothetical protein
MHADDDALRAALNRDRAGQPTYDAETALSSIRPAMVRVRRHRLLVRTAAMSVLVIGSFGAASALRGGPTSIRTGVGDEPAPGIPPASSLVPTPVHPAPEHAEGGDHQVSAGVIAGSSGASDADDLPSGSVPARSTPPGDGTDSATDDGIDQGNADLTGADRTGADPAPPSPTTPAPRSQAASGEPPATEPPAGEPGQISVPISVPGAQQWFTSACGSVLADRSSGEVVVIEVRPVAGYTYRLEDREDDGDQTVQFTGTGEDCELKISASSAGG